MERRTGLCAGLCGALALWLTATAAAAGNADGNANGLPPITTSDWQETVISVTDLDRTARFFREIGGYEVKWRRSEEHTSELQSLRRISYAVFCLKKKKK